MLADLRLMWGRGDYVREIALRLGVSSDAVSQKARDLKLCMHPSTTPQHRSNLRVLRHIWSPADFRFWTRVA